MAKKNRAVPAVAVAAAAALCLADAWLAETVKETGEPLGDPKIPKIQNFDVKLEVNGQGVNNGANVKMQFGPDVYVSREVDIQVVTGKDDQGNETKTEVFKLNLTNVRAQCGLTDQSLVCPYATASLWVGNRGSKDATFLASALPLTKDHENFFQKAVTDLNKNPELVKNFREKGYLKTYKSGENTVNVLSFPLNALRWEVYVFCRIDRDGKLKLDLEGSYWSFSSNGGTAPIFKMLDDGSLIPSTDNRNQKTRGFRGEGQGSNRAKKVYEAINAQFKASKAYKIFAEFKGQHSEERRNSIPQAPRSIDPSAVARQGFRDQSPSVVDPQATKGVVNAGTVPY